MKKGLLAVVVVLACALVGAGIATAAEISTSGVVEFQISGTSAAGEASGLFGEADTDATLSYSFALDAAPWRAGITATIELVDCTEDPE